MPARLRRQTEADFRTQAIQAASAFGYLVAAIRPVRIQRKNGQVYYETPMEATGAGWPDLFIAHKTERRPAWGLELKIGDNKATPQQIEWLAALNRATCVKADVLRPEAWNWFEATIRGQ